MNQMDKSWHKMNHSKVYELHYIMHNKIDQIKNIKLLHRKQYNEYY